MQICPECHHKNPNNVLMCEQCGALLDEEDAAFQTIVSRQNINLESVKPETTNKLSEEGKLVLHIEEKSITLSVKKIFILGRKTPDKSSGSLVNLTPFDAYKKGVSRNHAQIRLGDDGYLKVTDLGSNNGTFINGKKITHLQPHTLHNGDKLRLSELVIHIQYHEPV